MFRRQGFIFWRFFCSWSFWGPIGMEEFIFSQFYFSLSWEGLNRTKETILSEAVMECLALDHLYLTP